MNKMNYYDRIKFIYVMHLGKYLNIENKEIQEILKSKCMDAIESGYLLRDKEVARLKRQVQELVNITLLSAIVIIGMVAIYLLK